ncbi:MAG: hypothetical protein AAB368_14180 [bacterium]
MSEVRRTQVYLEHALYEQLRRQAFASRRTLSACLRDILAGHFKVGPKRKNAAAALLELSGMVKGDRAPVGRFHDEYLAQALEEELRENRDVP